MIRRFPLESVVSIGNWPSWYPGAPRPDQVEPQRQKRRPSRADASRAHGFPGSNGSGYWTRTSDPAVNSRLLYRLS